MIGSYFCSCVSGYELENDEWGCTDIDECANGVDECNQMCMNINGSYECSCNAGYHIASDGLMCDGNTIKNHHKI